MFALILLTFWLQLDRVKDRLFVKIRDCALRQRPAGLGVRFDVVAVAWGGIVSFRRFAVDPLDRLLGAFQARGAGATSGSALIAAAGQGPAPCRPAGAGEWRCRGAAGWLRPASEGMGAVEDAGGRLRRDARHGKLHGSVVWFASDRPTPRSKNHFLFQYFR